MDNSPSNPPPIQPVAQQHQINPNPSGPSASHQNLDKSPPKAIDPVYGI
jgi:hypothetical protein